jgi:iron complex transport system ATP-binding protein
LVIVVLHDLMLAHTFADTILVLQNGVLAAVGTAEEPLSRGSIENIFGVSFAGEVCPRRNGSRSLAPRQMGPRTAHH